MHLIVRVVILASPVAVLAGFGVGCHCKYLCLSSAYYFFCDSFQIASSATPSAASVSSLASTFWSSEPSNPKLSASH
jgi:hypothetical protein